MRVFPSKHMQLVASALQAIADIEDTRFPTTFRRRRANHAAMLIKQLRALHEYRDSDFLSELRADALLLLDPQPAADPTPD
jgi:hypothetical protein